MERRDDTHFSTPIPLRDNGIGVSEGIPPTPYERMAAVTVVGMRLALLAALVEQGTEDPRRVQLAAVLVSLKNDLRRASYGDLADVRALREADNPTEWGKDLSRLLWDRWP